MLRTILQWLFGRSGDDAEQADTERRFLPSRLDHSVRISHGGGAGEADRELTTTTEHAEDLEAIHREE